MSNVRISGLTKRFEHPPTVAVDNLDLEAREGEFLVLLGPSGCGKTTTLRCLAGLESPTEGTLSIGDRAVFDSTRRLNIAPDKRQIGMVFQSYALWPHMTVRKNIQYPLKARRMKQGLEEGWAEQAAALVDCAALLDRLPGQLSGGQQQRVALARGLVARPDLVLFDEPLSNLDARLRDQVRSELHELHRRLGFTAIYVTHDQSEALALGDRLAIMRAGRLEQLGTPEEVFERPDTEYVADFIGMSNRLDIRSVDGRSFVGGLAMWGEPAPPGAGGSITARLRPDQLYIRPAGQYDGRHPSVDAEIADITYGGRHRDVTVGIGDQRCFLKTPISEDTEWIGRAQPGTRVRVWFRWSDAAAFDAAGERVVVQPSSAAAMSVVQG